MVQITQKFTFIFSLSICFLMNLATCDSNQIKIENNFRLSPNHSTEMLKTIITDVETSEDSGIVIGIFYIYSVSFPPFNI